MINHTFHTFRMVKNTLGWALPWYRNSRKPSDDQMYILYIYSVYIYICMYIIYAVFVDIIQRNEASRFGA